MRKILDSIMQYYNSLSSRGKLILAFAVLVILMAFSSLIINNSYRNDEINYNKLTAEKIMQDSNVVYNRSEIATIDDIVKKVLMVENGQLIFDGEKVTLKDLYKNTVLDNYKKKLSYSKFKNKMNYFYQKILTNKESINLDNGTTFIKKVYYSYPYDMYLIEINEEYENENTYIGVRLVDNNEYRISFVE